MDQWAEWESEVGQEVDSVVVAVAGEESLVVVGVGPVLFLPLAVAGSLVGLALRRVLVGKIVLLFLPQVLLA